MTSLQDLDQGRRHTQLSLELDLTGLETYGGQMSEGWLQYDFKLTHNGKALVRITGTVHDTDLRDMENIFNNLKEGSFEPMEPDFELKIDALEDDEYTLTCMVNVGADIDGIYSDSALGMRLVITNATARTFAADLRSERIALTKDVDFSDYRPRQLAD